jgi:hypothetical protein
MSVTELIIRLSEIERSIGVESNHTIHKQVMDAQDCALRVQAKMVDMLRAESVQGAAGIVPDVFVEPTPPLSGWRPALAGLLPLATLSPHWRR